MEPYARNPDSIEYKQGQSDHAEGLDYEDCPYDTGSQSWFDWGDGWLDADDVELLAY